MSIVFRTISFWLCVVLGLLNVFLVFVNQDHPPLRNLCALNACLLAFGAFSHWLGLVLVKPKKR